MTQIRYSSSFIISSIVYLAIIFAYFNLIDIQKPIKKEKEKKIKIALISPPPPPIVPKKVEPKPIIKPTPPPPPIIQKPKPKPKPKPKKKIIKKPKKIVKKIKKRVKKTPKKKIIKKRVVQKKVIKQPKKIIHHTPKKPKVANIEPELIYQEVIQTPPTPTTPKVVTQPKKIVKAPPKKKINSKDKEKRKFLKIVRESIYTNKRYPLKAKRRNIEGRVHAVFDILPNGEITNIRLSNAPRVLKREVRRSLRKSFPIDIPPSLLSEFPMRNVSVNVDFKLR